MKLSLRLLLFTQPTPPLPSIRFWKNKKFLLHRILTNFPFKKHPVIYPLLISKLHLQSDQGFPNDLNLWKIPRILSDLNGLSKVTWWLLKLTHSTWDNHSGTLSTERLWYNLRIQQSQMIFQQIKCFWETYLPLTVLFFLIICH